MKLVLTIFLLCIACLQNLAQDISGKWYIITRNGLTEIEFSDDSMTTRLLTKDFIHRGRDNESYPFKRVSLPDQVLVIGKSKKHSKFSAMVLFNIRNEKYFQTAWNVSDTAVSDPDTLIRLHMNNKRTLKGFYAFSEYYIDTLKKMKRVEQMPLEDFLLYANTYVDKVNATFDEFTETNDGYLSPFIYNYQIIYQTLFEIGYNPLANAEALNGMMKKYYELSESKKIFKRLKVESDE